MINALVRNLGKDIICATISNPGMEKLDFFNYVARVFRIKRRFDSKGEFLIYFSHFLHKAMENNKRVLLIVDEAQKLTQELLDEIRLLSNTEIPNSKLINIFFIGQNEFNDILNRSENEALKQRITLNYNLKALTKREMRQYIQHRLAVCGSENNMFKKEAVEAIHILTNGIPRRVNILCDHCLLTGYVKGKKKIDQSIVKECAEELAIKNTRPVREKIPAADFPVGKERSFAKAAVYLSAFILLWGLIGFFYYTDNGYSLNTVEKYWTHRYNDIKSRIFPGSARDDNARLDATETTKAPQMKDHIREPSPSTAFSRQKANTPEENRMQTEITGKSNFGSDLQSRLDAFAQLPEDKDSHALKDPAPAFEKEAFAAAPEKQPAEPKSNEPVVKNVALMETGPPDQTEPMPQRVEEENDAEDAEKSKTAGEPAKPPDTIFTIYFNYNSGRLSADEIRVIGDVVEISAKHPKAKLNVKGHTDSLGNFESNLVLSEQRAGFVKNFLVKKGIDRNRINTIAMADREPIANNDHAAGRSRNRRVEIQFIQE